MEATAVTDRGLVRARNEDSYLIDDKRALFILCDGMGGHKAGNVASQLAVEVIAREYRAESEQQIRDSLRRAIIIANKAIWTEGNRNVDYRDMGTTAVVAVIFQMDGEFRLIVANVGDSRLYIIRQGTIRQVTVDHTVAEQMRSQGILSQEESQTSPFSHVLTRALGTHYEVEAEFFEESLEAGDLILMCSDGLSDMLMQNELLEIGQKEADIRLLAEHYLKSALDKGGHDNVTLIIIGV